MSRSFIEFEQSAGWLILLLLISSLLSYLLYQKKNVPWSSFQNWVLFALRSIAIFFLLLLFLEPSIKRIISRIEPPIIGLAVDNSQSITARENGSMSIVDAISKLRAELEEEGIAYKLVLMDDTDTLQFEAPISNLSLLLSKSHQNKEDKNYVATVLFTDGIYNRGSSPLYKNYVYPIFTVGMGDTIAPKDISITRVQYNKVSFMGNETPLQVELNHEGYFGKKVSIQVNEGGKQVVTKDIILESRVEEIEFNILNEKEGLRHLVVTVSTFEDESSRDNNRADAFLEVKDNANSVLIIASRPHPDIRAIRSTLESTKSYSTSVYIPSLNTKAPNKNYDVVIYHGAFSSTLDFAPEGEQGSWYILNLESNLDRLNQALPYFNIRPKAGQPDEVSGSFNANFSKFKIEDAEVFENYPPIEVPYADYHLVGGGETLIYQRLGSITTSKPLMVVFDDEVNKSAILMGQNIWKWKLQEFAVNENAKNFDNFIIKTVQFLAIKNDKEQFRFAPRFTTFSYADPILFDAEIYNDIYERIYGNETSIIITNESGENQQYSFNDSEINGTFKIPNLSPGIYRYKASVKVSGRFFEKKGEFLVAHTNIEFADLQANHQLLKTLSANTNASFVHFDQIALLPSYLQSRNFKSIVKSEESKELLIQAWWWYLIIFLLFTAEWVLRKYWGGY